MSESLKKSEWPALLVKEAFHSFHLKDEFTASYLADLAFNSLNKKMPELKMEVLLKKASSFIHRQKKQGLIEKTDKKWRVSVNGKQMKRPVYRKVGELSEWKTKSNQLIPIEYEDFVSVWNELEVGASVTAEEFHDHLNKEEIEVTYIGQVGKFLWMIADMNFCEWCKDINGGPNSCLYTRVDSIPLSAIGDGEKFYTVRDGNYQSKLSLF